jgi:hypothetical protein
MATKKMEQLVRKWAPMLEGLNTDRDVRIMSQLLETEDRYFSGQLGEDVLTESGTLSTPQPATGLGGDGTTSGIARYKRIAIPMVRRVFPELLANQLVGVQPMSGPVGLAYALRFRRDDNGTELGYNNMDAGFTSRNGTGASDPTAVQNSPAMAGSATVGTAVNPISAAANTTDGTSAAELWGSAPATPGEGSLGEGDQYPEVALSIEQKEIVAGTRKLKARWSLEAQQDLAHMHAVDIEEEIMDLMAYEISAEIDREIVNRIRVASVSGGNGNFTWAFDATNANTSGQGRWEQEQFRTLYTKLIKMSNDIAISTRRGPGNFVICSPNVVSALESLDRFSVSPVDTALDSSVTGLAMVGTIGRFKVYRDSFAKTDYAVVGYKGAKDNDSGIIYCPYVPVMFHRATGEENFAPRVGVMTRYGICDHLFGAETYYRYLAVDFSGSSVEGVSNAGTLAPNDATLSGLLP